MKKFIFSLLVLIAIIAKADNPGYQGLHFSVKYDCGIMHPIIVGRPGKLPMLYHNGAIDYAISRKFSVGISYGFMHYNSHIDTKLANQYIYDFYGSSSDFSAKYLQHTVSIYLKDFVRKRGFIAPVGLYYKYGLFYQYARNNYEYPITIEGSYYYDETYKVEARKATVHTIGLALGVGRNFVVANRILIDFGMDVNISFPPFGFIEQLNETVDIERKYNYREYLCRNLLQLHLGIGVLAF